MRRLPLVGGIVGLIAVGVFLGLAAAVPVAAAGIRTQTYWGCYRCDAEGLTGMGAVCEHVGDNENGDGIKCQETTGIPGGTLCLIERNPCYNVVVDNGPNAPTSGGGGDTCRYENGYCAPWCSACSQYGG